MDVEKLINTTEFKIFNLTIFKIVRRQEVNYKEDVEPIVPVIEINFDDTHNHN